MLIRTARQSDGPEVVDLLLTAFRGRPRSLAHWEWSHEDGRGVSVVAEDSGRIMGHYSFGLQEFGFRGARIVGGLGQQAAVHPDHRDLRTIVEIVRFAEEAASRTCAFVFGFPNSNMRLVKERALGWRRTQDIPYWGTPVDQFASRVRSLLEGTDVSSCEVRRLTSVNGIDCADVAGEGLGELTPFRDNGWFEWRYLRNPLNHYELLGAFQDGGIRGLTVLKTYHSSGSTTGHVLELHGSDRSPRLSLLSASAELFQSASVAHLVVWNQDAHNKELFEEVGLVRTSSSTALYAKPLADDLNDVCDAEWSFDMGVSDVF